MLFIGHMMWLWLSLLVLHMAPIHRAVAAQESPDVSAQIIIANLDRVDIGQNDPFYIRLPSSWSAAGGSTAGVSKVANSSLTSPSSCPHTSGFLGKFANKGAGRNPYQSLPQTEYSLGHETPE